MNRHGRSRLRGQEAEVFADLELHPIDLGQESGDNGAGQLTISYFDPGGYTVTDANGDITKILYDVNGNPAQITDPLGNVSQVRYDSNGQPTMTGLVTETSAVWTGRLQGAGIACGPVNDLGAAVELAERLGLL